MQTNVKVNFSFNFNTLTDCQYSIGLVNRKDRRSFHVGIDTNFTLKKRSDFYNKKTGVFCVNPSPFFYNNFYKKTAGVLHAISHASAVATC